MEKESETVMSTALLTAAALSAAIGIVHSWLGERRLIGPLLDPETRTGMLAHSAFARSVLRFAWHITTIAWIGIGAVFAIFATAPLTALDRSVLVALALTMAVTGAVIFYTGRGRHWAWPVFLAIAALAAYPALA